MHRIQRILPIYPAAILALATALIPQGPAHAQEGSAAPAPPVELAASHVLIQWQGSMRAPATVTRTKEEALTLATDVAKKAKGGESFEALAREYSEGPSGATGGDLGVFRYEQMIPEFSLATSRLAVGGISDPVETQFGYHVIRRNEVLKASARHILIQYAGATRAPATTTRTQKEALAFANQLLAQLQAGAEFEALAQEHSDGPSAPRGGDLGSILPGQMVPAFDQAVFALEPGGLSEVVETPFGYHLILRY